MTPMYCPKCGALATVTPGTRETGGAQRWSIHHCDLEVIGDHRKEVVWKWVRVPASLFSGAPSPKVVTLGMSLSAAALCRLNGWTAGTRLVGMHPTQDYASVITITAVGREWMLAAEDGKGEGVWELNIREWRAL